MRHFRLGEQPGSAPRRRFRLATPPAPVAHTPPPTDKPYIPRVWGSGVTEPAPAPVVKAKVQTPARKRAQVSTTHVVKAPAPARRDRRQVVALLASDAWMPGSMGPLRLRIDRAAVDLTRVERGNMPACLDHSTERPFGRVVEARIGGGMLAVAVEVSNGALGDEAFESITEGTRGGWSPGYYVTEARMLSPKDDGFDAKQLQIEVVRHMPLEASLVATPMNSSTRTLSVHEGERADMRNDIVIDMIDLSYKTAKAVLAGESGSEDQRKRLTAYVGEYDRQVAAGTGRLQAAMAARAVALA